MAQFVDVLDLDDKQSFIMLLVEEGLSKSEATDAYDSLRLVYEKYQSAFDALSAKQRAAPRHYWILETEEGPRISDSRVMVYDVLDYQNQGFSSEEIALICNLTLRQVKTALDYIARHHDILEVELTEIKARMAAEEISYRATQAKVKAKNDRVSLTLGEKRKLYQTRKPDPHDEK
jgi:uncharacterized protein (DUF433 family)